MNFFEGIGGSGRALDHPSFPNGAANLEAKGDSSAP